MRLAEITLSATLKVVAATAARMAGRQAARALMAAALAACSVHESQAASDPPPQFGPIKPGMSLEQIRKLLRPGSWETGSADRIKATDAIEIDGVLYSIEYVVYPERRISFSAKHLDDNPISAKECRAQINRLFSSEEVADGPYAPSPPPWKGRLPKHTVVAVGKTSRAMQIAPVPGFGKGSIALNAARKTATSEKRIGGGFWKRRGDLVSCSFHVDIDVTPPPTK